jgi:hypothetical protein
MESPAWRLKARHDKRRARISTRPPVVAYRLRRSAKPASAPTNEAFGNLPTGTDDTLVKPENKATLTKILTYQLDI